MTVRSKKLPEIAVATKQGPAALACGSQSHPLVRQTAEWLLDYLGKRGLLADEAALSQSGASLWVLETRAEHPISAGLDIDTSFLDRARPESYILSVQRLDRRAVVAVIGRDADGVRAGVARLIALLKDVDGDLFSAQLREETQPFYRVRRFGIDPTGRLAQNGPYADTLAENWTDERLRAYIEQIWLMGFNAVEVTEIRVYIAKFTDDELAEKITPKVRTMMAAARDYGLKVYQFVWAQCLVVEGKTLCWNDPEERETMKREYDRLARTYGDLVDCIIVHVRDPGGCTRNGCDGYRTPQQLAVQLLAAYRRVNPKVEAVLSTWANPGFWRGAPADVLLGEAYMPREIGIALHRWYDRDEARMVRESGRALEIWSWYLGDFEMALDMTLNMTNIDRYYSALPDRASREVRAINSETCFHALPSIINGYVAAQKMWNPRRSLDEILREFCAGMFGQANAEAMVAVYRACEKYVHKDRCYAYRPETDLLPDVFGTAAYNRELRRAIEMGQAVKLSPNPRFTQATDPRVLYDYLMRNVRLISVFSHAAGTINASGETSAEAKAAVDAAIREAAAWTDDADYPTLLKRLPSDLVPEEAGKSEVPK